MATNEIEIKVKTKFDFDIGGKKIFEFLKKHYKVPENVVGATLTFGVDELTTVEWRTVLTNKVK